MRKKPRSIKKAPAGVAAVADVAAEADAGRVPVSEKRKEHNRRIATDSEDVMTNVTTNVMQSQQTDQMTYAEAVIVVVATQAHVPQQHPRCFRNQWRP